MRSILIAFFLLLAATSEGTVLIYKGPFSTKTVPADNSKAGGAYLVYEIETRKFAVISYFRKDGVKQRLHDEGTFYFGTVNLPRGKTATVLSDETKFEDIGQASHSYIRLKGNNGTLVYNAQAQTVLFPSVLAGNELVSSYQVTTASTADTRFTLKYQAEITKEKQGKAFDTVTLELHILLFQQGYGSDPLL